jgi:anti-sigma factor RsiW
MTACPDKELELHAFVDGELDAIGSAAFEAHVRSCAACAEELERALAVRAALQGPAVRREAPTALWARLETLAPRSEETAEAERRAMPRRLSWGSFATGGGIGALAASLALFLALPQLSAPGLSDELVASHVRSLQAAHLVDVATSNRHVVKPWFNGKIDFAPPVPDLAGQGFPLVGGRLDVIDGRSVAALVYKRNLHSINLFVRPATWLSLQSERTFRRDSYSLAHWTSSGLDYWAVSDVDPADLSLFARTFQGAVSSGGLPESKKPQS